MTDGWTPFDEAQFRLNQYDHFFSRTVVANAFGDHPQKLEDWLTENCPKNYCYVWVYNRRKWGSTNPKIIGELVGIPKDAALALKLITAVDILHNDSFTIIKRYERDNVYSYRVEELEYSD